jgi:hypothetical protein
VRLFLLAQNELRAERDREMQDQRAQHEAELRRIRNAR